MNETNNTNKKEGKKMKSTTTRNDEATELLERDRREALNEWKDTYDHDRRQRIMRSLRQAMVIISDPDREGRPVSDQGTWEDIEAVWQEYVDMREDWRYAIERGTFHGR